MNIKENKPLRADGTIDLDNRNYITLGMTYNEFLDLRSLLQELLRKSEPGAASGNLWVNQFLLGERDVRLAVNLKKRLEKIL